MTGFWLFVYRSMIVSAPAPGVKPTDQVSGCVQQQEDIRSTGLRTLLGFLCIFSFVRWKGIAPGNHGEHELDGNAATLRAACHLCA